MFHTVADFLILWQQEAKSTEKLFSALSNEVLNKKFAPGVRTLKQLAWHLIETPKEMLERTGLKGIEYEHPEASSITVPFLIEAHRKVVKSVAHQIQTHWHNKDLHLTDNMYGEEWTRGQTLTALTLHLVHHRGQMTVLMRLADLMVPGLYGPAKEEWQKYGMEQPLEIQ